MIDDQKIFNGLDGALVEISAGFQVVEVVSRRQYDIQRN
jgi:hypothetical protein